MKPSNILSVVFWVILIMLGIAEVYLWMQPGTEVIKKIFIKSAIDAFWVILLVSIIIGLAWFFNKVVRYFRRVH